jgi:hypothetical protein
MGSRAIAATFAAIATFVLSSLASAPASAAGWFVAGTKLTGSSALASTAAVEEYTTLTIGNQIRIVCTGAGLGAEESYIGASTSGMANSLAFGKCGVTEPSSGCKLEGQPINLRTYPLTLTASAMTGSSVKLLWQPLTKHPFLALPFAETNTTCIYNDLQPVGGSVAMLAPKGGEESMAQLVESLGSFENNSLETGGARDYFESGRYYLKLASSSKWSFGGKAAMGGFLKFENPETTLKVDNKVDVFSVGFLGEGESGTLTVSLSGSGIEYVAGTCKGGKVAAGKTCTVDLTCGTSGNKGEVKMTSSSSFVTATQRKLECV